MVIVMIMASKVFQTNNYRITVEETAKVGPGGYESIYLTSEGDPASKEMYSLLIQMQGISLPAENRSIRQRNGSELVKAIKEGKPLGIASGFKPSGAYHFGHKLTSSTVAFFQKNNVQVFIPVADIECEMDTKLSREEYLYWAADNLIDLGANGVNLDAAHVYLQSEEKRVSDLAYKVARGLTFDFAVDTYGFEKLCGDPSKAGDKGDFPFLFAGITQVGDIILPQHPDFGNFHSFMVSGQDQDGHMKMTIGLIKRSIESGRHIPGLQTIPSSFYIPHIRGLTGSKASSSKIEGTLYLGSGPQRYDLNQRIKAAHESIDTALADTSTREYVGRCALFMIRFIDFFNKRSKITFRELIEKLPSSLTEKLEGEIDGKKQAEILDLYLIEECQRNGQDNVELVRGSIKDALIDHQQRRQKVYSYALAKATAQIQTGWETDSAEPESPEFWQVPMQSIVNHATRNKTKWFDIINQVHDKIIP